MTSKLSICRNGNSLQALASQKHHSVTGDVIVAEKAFQPPDSLVLLSLSPAAGRPHSMFHPEASRLVTR